MAHAWRERAEALLGRDEVIPATFGEELNSSIWLS